MTEVFVLASIKASDGYESEVVEAIRALAVSSQAEQGCLNYDLYSSRDVLGETLIFETWVNLDALSLHGKTEHIASFKKAIKGKADVTVQKLQSL